MEEFFCFARVSSENFCEARENWRRGGDSNPRYLAVHNISSVARSATLSPLRLCCNKVLNIGGVGREVKLKKSYKIGFSKGEFLIGCIFKRFIPLISTLKSKIFLMRLFFIGLVIGHGGSLHGEFENFWPFKVVHNDHDTGERTSVDMAGPFAGQEAGMKSVRPGSVQFYKEELEQREFHYLYPMLNYYSSRYNTSWDFFSFFNYTKTTVDNKVRFQRMTLFPFYFAQKTGDPERDYHGLFPVGGYVRGYFNSKKISWFAFPLALQIEKTDETRYAFPWPVIRWSKGPKSGGGTFWPLVGHFWKKGDYDRQYGMWPLVYYNKEDLHKKEPTYKHGFLPFYAFEKSEKRESTTVLWPFFSRIHGKKPDVYVEDQFMWPFVVKARGANRNITRVAPFYSHSNINGTDRKWYLWPLMKKVEWKDKDLIIDQQQLLYFLVWRQRQRSAKNPKLAAAYKTHVWPLYSTWDNGAGEKQKQFFSPFEVFFPDNRIVRKAYTPLFAFYRSHEKPNGYRYRGVFFNFITHERGKHFEQFTMGPIFESNKDPNQESFQFLKGLIGYQKNHKSGKNTFKFLWMSM